MGNFSFLLDSLFLLVSRELGYILAVCLIGEIASDIGMDWRASNKDSFTCETDSFLSEALISLQRKSYCMLWSSYFGEAELNLKELRE